MLNARSGQGKHYVAWFEVLDTYTVYCNILYTFFCDVHAIATSYWVSFTQNCRNEIYSWGFSPIQPSNYLNSKPSSFLLALIRVCITWTTTLNSLPCICWVLFATNGGLDEGATQVGSSWDHGDVKPCETGHAMQMHAALWDSHVFFCDCYSS